MHVLSALLWVTFFWVVQTKQSVQADPAKVFVIGLFKTGTTSMTAALQKMGLGCGHKGKLTTCGFNSDIGLSELDWFSGAVPSLVKKNDAVYRDILDLSDKATLFADAPYLFLYKEMDKRHDNAKFVLTLRAGGVPSYVESELRMWEKLGILQRLAAELLLDVVAAETWARTQLAKRYNDHVSNVREYFRGRSDDLLEITLGQNTDVWYTLREFLGHKAKLPAPGVAFPHLDFSGRAVFSTAPPVEDTKLPTVSLVMPTANRPEFVLQALKRVSKQDYPRGSISEVIIIDDGSPPVDLSTIPTLLNQTLPPVVLISPEKQTSIGQKRNIGADHATGDVIVHWDDDDVFGSTRLREQVEPIVREEADITLFRHLVTWFLDEGRVVQSENSAGNGPHFGTMAYRSRLVTGTRFADADLAEDYDWAERAVLGASSARILLLNQRTPGTFMCTRHGANTWTWRGEQVARLTDSTHGELPASVLPQYEREFGKEIREMGLLKVVQARRDSARPISRPPATDNFLFFTKIFRQQNRMRAHTNSLAVGSRRARTRPNHAESPPAFAKTRPIKANRLKWHEKFRAARSEIHASRNLEDAPDYQSWTDTAWKSEIDDRDEAESACLFLETQSIEDSLVVHDCLIIKGDVTVKGNVNVTGTHSNSTSRYDLFVLPDGHLTVTGSVFVPGTALGSSGFVMLGGDATLETEGDIYARHLTMHESAPSKLSVGGSLNIAGKAFQAFGNTTVTGDLILENYAFIGPFSSVVVNGSTSSGSVEIGFQSKLIVGGSASASKGMTADVEALISTKGDMRLGALELYDYSNVKVEGDLQSDSSINLPIYGKLTVNGSVTASGLEGRYSSQAKIGENLRVMHEEKEELIKKRRLLKGELGEGGIQLRNNITLDVLGDVGSSFIRLNYGSSFTAGGNVFLKKEFAIWESSRVDIAGSLNITQSEPEKGGALLISDSAMMIVGDSLWLGFQSNDFPSSDWSGMDIALASTLNVGNNADVGNIQVGWNSRFNVGGDVKVWGYFGLKRGPYRHHFTAACNSETSIKGNFQCDAPFQLDPGGPQDQGGCPGGKITVGKDLSLGLSTDVSLQFNSELTVNGNVTMVVGKMDGASVIVKGDLKCPEGEEKSGLSLMNNAQCTVGGDFEMENGRIEIKDSTMEVEGYVDVNKGEIYSLWKGLITSGGTLTATTIAVESTESKIAASGLVLVSGEFGEAHEFTLSVVGDFNVSKGLSVGGSKSFYKVGGDLSVDGKLSLGGWDSTLTVNGKVNVGMDLNMPGEEENWSVSPSLTASDVIVSGSTYLLSKAQLKVGSDLLTETFTAGSGAKLVVKGVFVPNDLVISSDLQILTQCIYTRGSVVNETWNPKWPELKCESSAPTSSPTFAPTLEPTFAPTFAPTLEPTIEPTFAPTLEPTIGPTFGPTLEPTIKPTFGPTLEPTIEPTFEPTLEPTIEPTFAPTSEPIIEPTFAPTSEAMMDPTLAPTLNSSDALSTEATPIAAPIAAPVAAPVAAPDTDKPKEMVFSGATRETLGVVGVMVNMITLMLLMCG